MRLKLTFLSLLFVLGIKAQAQNVGIGTNAPDASAKLDITDTDKGVLVPRISIPNLNAAAPVTAPAVSLFVYNTNVATGLGYYYWDGAKWVKLLNENDIDHDWYERGTTRPPDDINDFIYTQGRVSIGTTTGGADLNIGGAQIISFVGTAPSSSLISPGSMIINANGGSANITTRAEEFRFNGFDAGTLSTVNMRGIDAGHTALTLGLNTGQTRNVMQITDDANLPVTVFDNEGYLGIGTAAPNKRLHIKGQDRSNSNGFGISLQNDGTRGKNFFILTSNENYIHGSGKFLISGGNTSSPKFVIDSLGDIGLGIIDPSEKLDVDGQVRIREYEQGTAVTDTILVADVTGIVKKKSIEDLGLATTDTLEWGDAGTYIFAKDADAAGNDVVVTDAGQIGIGTTTPSTKLNVVDNTYYTVTTRPGTPLKVDGRADGAILMEVTNNHTNNTADAQSTGIKLSGYDHLNNREHNAFIYQLQNPISASTNRQGALVFEAPKSVIFRTNQHSRTVTDYGSTKTNLIIDDVGNVGIGTSTPAYLTHLSSTNAAHLAIEGNNTGYINAGLVLKANQGSNTRALGTFMYDRGSQTEWFAGRPYSGSDRFIVHRKASQTDHNDETSAIRDGIGNPTTTERFFTIENNGYTGVGVQPADGPDARLHVASGGNTANNYTAKFTSSPSTAGAGGIVFTNTEAVTATGFKWYTQGTGVGTFADDDLILTSVTVNSGATNANNIFTIQGNGNIGLGIVNSANPIQHSSGAILSAAGTWVDASDRRLKQNIFASKYGLKEVLNLRSVDYTMIKGGSRQVGFIAQEVQKIVPEVVHGIEGDLQKNETLGIAYGQLVPVLTKAIQEQQALIEAQKTEIENLKADNTTKNSAINSLQSNLDKVDERLKKLEILLSNTAKK